MLTAELLSEFVKTTTKTEDKRFKKDQNVYGTTVEYNGQIYVKIDGSDILTPVNTTVSMKGGERVILTIKNHSADVTGNLSSPSCGTVDIDDRVLQVKTEVENELDKFKTTITGSFVSSDDLDQVKEDLKSQTDQAISEANKVLQEDFKNLEARVETSESTWEQTFDGFKSTVAGTYLTKEEFKDSDIGNLKTSVTQLQQDLTGFKTTVAGTYATKDDFNNSNKNFSDQVNDLQGDITDINSLIDSLTQTVEKNDTATGELKASMTSMQQDLTSFKTTVAGTYATTDSVNGLSTSITQVTQDLTSFKSTVAGTYLTKGEFEDSDVGNLKTTVTKLEQDLTGFKTTVAGTYATTDSVNQVSASVSQLEQNLTGFKTTVTKTYATKTDIDNVSIGGKNYILNSGFKGKETKLLGSVSKWSYWGNINIYSGQGTTNFNRDNTIYLANKTTSASGIMQDISSNKIPPGTKCTISYYFSKESNVKSAGVQIEYYNANGGINEYIKLGGNEGKNVFTFTTPTTVYAKLRVYIYHDGISDSSNEYSCLITIGDLKLELGSKATDYTEAPEDIDAEISSVEQTANKISLIVKSGDSESNLVLTDAFYSVISENITLSADRITMEGLVTANSNFKILTDGSCEATDIVVSNTVAANTINANDINIPWVTKSLVRDLTIKMKPLHTHSDGYNLLNEDTYKSFSDLMGVCPGDLNGHTLTVDMLDDLTENVSLAEFSNGIIHINMRGHAIKGHIYSPNKSLSVYMFGYTSTEFGTGTNGKMIPGSVGKLYNGFRYAIVACQGYLKLYEIDFYAGTSTDYATKGVTMSEGGYIYVHSCRAINKPDSLIRVQDGARGYMDSSYGATLKSSIQAVSGGLLQLNAYTQCGKAGGDTSTFVANNGLIYSTGVTFQTTAITDDDSSNTNTSTDTTTTKTTTISSDYGRCYRTTVYNNWGSDNVVRQGQYGYGMNKGLWFFGDDLYNIIQNAKSIDGIAIKITRQAGGVYAAHTHYVRAHTYGVKPTGNPTFIDANTFQATFSIPTNSSTIIYLTAAQIAALKASGAKGFGLYTDSTDRGMYSTCSGNCIVTITYKE